MTPQQKEVLTPYFEPRKNIHNKIFVINSKTQENIHNELCSYQLENTEKNSKRNLFNQLENTEKSFLILVKTSGKW